MFDGESEFDGAPLPCFLTHLELSQDAEGIPTHTVQSMLAHSSPL